MSKQKSFDDSIPYALDALFWKGGGQRREMQHDIGPDVNEVGSVTMDEGGTPRDVEECKGAWEILTERASR